MLWNISSHIHLIWSGCLDDEWSVLDLSCGIHLCPPRLTCICRPVSYTTLRALPFTHCESHQSRNLLSLLINDIIPRAFESVWWKSRFRHYFELRYVTFSGHHSADNPITPFPSVSSKSLFCLTIRNSPLSFLLNNPQTLQMLPETSSKYTRIVKVFQILLKYLEKNSRKRVLTCFMKCQCNDIETW